MAGKGLTALITVVIGIGAALLLFSLLNKIAELLPGEVGGPDQAATSTSSRRSSRSSSTWSTRRS